MSTISRKDDQNFWNFLSTIVYAFLVFALGWLVAINRDFPTAIIPFDLLLITLAVFRLTRLFVYDKVTRFVRDPFLVKEEVISPEGEIMVVRRKHRSGVRRSISDLLDCPWCVAIWATPVVLTAYFLTPYAWYVILILAISGAAVFMEFLAHVTGWTAEYLKKLVKAR